MQELERRNQGRRRFEARVHVSEAGEVLTASVEHSSGTAEDDQSIIQWLRRAKFRPAKLDGVPVAGWWVGKPIR